MSHIGLRARLGIPVMVVFALVVAFLSTTTIVGADSMWLVAMGRSIAQKHAVPVGVPFAAADTREWVNVPVLGELLFAGVDALGDGALLAMQLALVVLTLFTLAATAIRLGASQVPTAVAILLTSLGSLPAFGVVRAQSLSLVCFAAMAHLLRCQQLRPNRFIWLAVPLTVLWGNLHGAVLVGVAVAGSYLIFSRLRRTWAAASSVGMALFVSLWLTPGGIRSHEYYMGVMRNVAAQRGVGLWAPLDLTSAFDALLIGSGLMLVALALARRLPVWEYVALTGLLAMTLTTSRHGIWLLMFAMPRAAQHLSCILGRYSNGQQRQERSRKSQTIKSFVAVLALASLATPGSLRQAGVVHADRKAARLVARAIGPTASALAPSPLAEWLATEGVKLWAGNPIDAFSAGRQSAYLDFLADPDTFRAGSDPAPSVVVVPLTLQRSAPPDESYATAVTVSGYTLFSRPGS